MRTRRIGTWVVGILIAGGGLVGCSTTQVGEPTETSVPVVVSSTGVPVDSVTTSQDGMAQTEPETITGQSDNQTSTAVVETTTSSTSTTTAKIPTTTTNGSKSPGGSTTTLETIPTTTVSANRGKIVDNGVYDLNGVKYAGSQTSTAANCSKTSDWTVTYWFRYENGTESTIKYKWSGSYPVVYLYKDGYGNYAPWTVGTNFGAEGEFVECVMGPTPGQ
jgi:hypothetical protein